MKKILPLLMLFLFNLACAVTQPSADNILYKPAGSGAVNETVKAKLDQIVNVKDFGALCDGSHDDTSAFTSALAVSSEVTIPVGTCVTDVITIPSNTHVRGTGIGTIIIPKVGISPSAFWQTAASATNVEVDHLRFDVSKVTYSSTVVFYVNAGQYINLHDINMPHAGIYGIYAVDAIDLTINNVQVFLSAGRAIFIVGTTNATSVRNRITNSYVSNAGGTDHCISFVHGSALEVSSTYTENCTMFGVSFEDVVGGIIQKNITYNTLAEGINLEDSSNVNITNNNLSWTGTTDQDFGLSIFGNTAHTFNNTVSNNVINNAGKACIGIAGGATYGSRYNTITGNICINPNRLNLSSANAGDGITLYGSATTKNIVSNNLIYDSTPYIHYGISEINNGGTPSYNKILNNQVDGVVTADISSASTTQVMKLVDTGIVSTKSLNVDNAGSTAFLRLGNQTTSTDADINFFTSGDSTADVELYGSGGTATADTGAFYINAWEQFFVSGYNTSNPTLLCGPTPARTSGFGTNPAAFVGNSCAFKITIGTGGTDTSGVLAMPTATNGWICDAFDQTTHSANVSQTLQTANSTTSVTLTQYNTSMVATAWTAGDVVLVRCTGY